MISGKKSICVIWIYDYIIKNKKITSKTIYENIDIIDRQLWRYMKDIKDYFHDYTEYELVYFKKTKDYRLITR